MSTPTRSEIEKEFEKIESGLMLGDWSDPESLECYQNALGWVLGIYTESPSQREA